MKHTPDIASRWPPEWINARDDGFRVYFGNDATIQVDGDLLTCKCTRQSTGVVYFFVFFMPCLIASCWFGIEDVRERVAFTFFGMFAGGAAFALIFAMMRSHETRGDYIVADRKEQVATLPRHDRSFDYDQLVALQRLAGKKRYSEVCNDVDLNLLVAEGDDVVRYHIMRRPETDCATAIAEHLGVPLVRTYCPTGWYLSSDRTKA